jgi:hypothetical protein
MFQRGIERTKKAQISKPGPFITLGDVRGRVREVAEGSRPFIANDSGKQIDNPAVAYTFVLEVGDNGVLRVVHVRVLSQPYLSLQPVPQDARDRLLIMGNSCIGSDWFYYTVVAAGGTQSFGLSLSSALTVSNEPDVYYIGEQSRVSLGTWPAPFELNVDYDTPTFPGNTSQENLTVWGRVVAVSEFLDIAQSWILVEDTYGIGKHPAYTAISLLRRDVRHRLGRVIRAHLPNERLNRIIAMPCADADGRYREGPAVRVRFILKTSSGMIGLMSATTAAAIVMR